MSISHLKKGTWTRYQVDADTQITQVTHNEGNTEIIYVEAVHRPDKLPYAITNYTGMKESVYFYGQNSKTFWMMPVDDDVVVTILETK